MVLKSRLQTDGGKKNEEPKKIFCCFTDAVYFGCKRVRNCNINVNTDDPIFDKKAGSSDPPEHKQETTYSYREYPLERNGIKLHLDCLYENRKTQDKSILLIHGVTYSSHEFDIDYEDYSLVRRLAREGYAVWRLDIAGFGQSGPVEDGFLPDSDYAAEDINAAIPGARAAIEMERGEVFYTL